LSFPLRGTERYFTNPGDLLSLHRL
jgi:hypothetical protein